MPGPLENFFGCQRERGGTSDNPTVQDNTQALRVVNSMCCGPVGSNCRGAAVNQKVNLTDMEPLAKRRKKN